MITSPANPVIKEIRKLRERKERQRTGTYLVEGVRIVGEAVRRPDLLVQLVVASDLLASEFGQALVAGERARGTPILDVSEAVFRSLALKDNPQGLAAVLRQDWQPIHTLAVGLADVWIALDAVADPGNLGTILRTADAVGARGLILLDQTTDPYDPTALRASMGAVFSQVLIRASFEEFAGWASRASLPVIGTSDKAARDYQDIEYPRPMALLMGSERQGLLPHHLQICRQVARIPMVGQSDSLNLAVATGVMLYEVFNQARRSDKPGAEAAQENEAGTRRENL